MRQDPADFVHPCFTIEVYKKAYSFGLPAINGERMWPKVVGNLVEPPLIRKMPGRPNEKRRRDQDGKDPQNPHRLRKVGVQMTCQRCFQIGHNSISCKNEAVQKPHKELNFLIQGKIGRPRKHPSTESSSRRHTNQQQTSQSEAKALKKVLAKERALAKKGIGRLVCERTGNAYIHMSSDSTIYYAPGASRVSSSATTSSTYVGISTTQESQVK